MADKVVIRSLDVPFQSGLSQKEEQRWQGPGGAQQALNLSQSKSKSFVKRPGRSATTNVGRQAFGNNALSIQSAKRIGAFNGNLVIIGADAYTDGIWSYDDAAGQPILYDRVPEVYAYPVKPLLSSDMPVSEGTSVNASNYRVTAFLADPTASGSKSVWYMVTDLVTGNVVQQAQSLDGSTSFANPRLITIGTTAILAYATATAANIFARKMDMTAPWNGFGAATIINDVLASTVPFAVSSITNNTTTFDLVYQASTGGAGGGPTSNIRCQTITAATLASTSGVNVADAQFVSDSKPNITGFCIRADSTIAMFVGYGYTTGGGTTRVKAAAMTLTSSDHGSGAQFMSAVEMDPGVTYVSPKIMSVVSAGTVNATTNSQQYAWSGSNEILGDTTNSAVGIRTAIVNAPGGTGTLMANQPRITYGAVLASEQLVISGPGGVAFPYMLGLIPSSLQGSYALFAQDSWQDIVTSSAYPMRYVASVAPRQALWSGDTQHLGYFSMRTTPSFQQNTLLAGAGSAYEVTIAVNQTPTIVGPALATFDLASTQGYASAQLGKNTVFASGVPFGFDGQRVFELAFPYFPESKFVGATTVSNVGGNMNTGSSGGVLNYIAIYEGRDDQGQVHRSARGAVMTVNTATVTTGNTGSVAVQVPTMGFSWRQRASEAQGGIVLPNAPSIVIKLYRTVVGGSVYYLCDPSDTVQHGFIAQPNTLSQSQVTLTDTISDGLLTANPLLYNDGSDGTQPSNILDNLCGPAFQHIVVHQNRFWGVDGSNIWFTKAFTTGEGSAFNESAMVFSVDDGPGYVTALATMDDKLVIFKDDRILYITGQGPADNGLDNDLIPPTRIPSDVGCIDWRSVVSWQKGVWFQSRNGLYLLTRDLQVQSAGKFVEDTLATYPKLTSASVNTPQGEIVWTANTDDKTVPRNGVLIRYNYVFDLWSTSQILDSAGNIAGAVSGGVTYAATSSSGVWTIAPAHHALGTNGIGYRETASTYLDAGSFVGAIWDSPWLKAADLQGWGFWDRFVLLYQMLDPADLTVLIFYNYSSTPTDTRHVKAQQIAAMTTPLAQSEFEPSNRNAQAVKIRIMDVRAGNNSTVTGQGFNLIGLRVDYGTYSSGFPVPPAQRSAA